MPRGPAPGSSLIPQAEESSLPAPVRIDVHTHIVPPDVVRGRRRYSQADLWFGRLYRNERRVLASADDLRRSMRRAGLAASVAFGFAWRDPGLCRANNDYVLDAVAASNDDGGQVIPFCVVPPGDLDFAAAEMERCRARGAVGVGELFPQGQGWNLNDRSAVRSFMDTVRSLGLILTVHTSEPVGHTYPGKDSTTPDAIWSVIEAAEGEVPIILAHWGGGLAFLRADARSSPAGPQRLLRLLRQPPALSAGDIPGDEPACSGARALRQRLPADSSDASYSPGARGWPAGQRPCSAARGQRSPAWSGRHGSRQEPI